jgi:hypothetical protein
VDTGRDSYEAAGAKIATFNELLGPRLVAKGALASRRDGVVQGRTVGHPAQLGGVMVVRPGNEIVYAHLADDAGDNPPNDEVCRLQAKPHRLDARSGGLLHSLVATRGGAVR